MFAAFALMSYVFYKTEFRDVLEEWFFDLRMRWAPAYQQIEDIAVVAIDDKAIEQLDSAQTRITYDGKKRPFLSIDTITRIAGLLANSEATSINILLPNHAFRHTDERLFELVEIVSYDQRMLIGTSEYNRVVPSVTQIPYPLRSIKERVYGYETFRKRSNALVRSLPYLSYRGLNEELMLPVKIVSQLKSAYGDLSDSYILNPLLPSQFVNINAGLAATDPKDFIDKVKGKVVIVGYTTPREIPFQTTDTMLVNTPLIGNEQTVEKGMSMTYLVANAVENLLHNRNIIPLDSVFNFLQTIGVAVLCGLAWELGSFTASTVTVIFWIVLIYVHAVMFRYLNSSIPLADTFFATSLVSIFAAVRRLNSELKDMASKLALAEAKDEIAKIQSHFLTNFASWLKSITNIIVSEVRTTEKSMISEHPKTADLYQRAFTAGEEFNDYLENIRQIPDLESKSKSIKKEQVDLEALISRITRRFEAKKTVRNIQIQLDIGSNATHVLANENLLDSIIYNFVSNAVKYSPNGSTIKIKTSLHDKKGIQISVIDQGPGIPLEMRDKIFEKFYRIQDDRLYQAKGSGLGLYLCKFFAEQMRGSVDVTAVSPNGSEFKVVLP